MSSLTAFPTEHCHPAMRAARSQTALAMHSLDPVRRAPQPRSPSGYTSESFAGACPRYNLRASIADRRYRVSRKSHREQSALRNHSLPGCTPVSAAAPFEIRIRRLPNRHRYRHSAPCRLIVCRVYRANRHNPRRGNHVLKTSHLSPSLSVSSIQPIPILSLRPKHPTGNNQRRCNLEHLSHAVERPVSFQAPTFGRV